MFHFHHHARRCGHRQGESMFQQRQDAAGRERGPRRGPDGLRPGRGGPGGFGGGDLFARGRKFSSDDLQLLLLALLEQQPSHGYELIKALETRSNGYYSPSPGMVYPALTYLEEIGHVTVEADANRKRYALAAPGREHLQAHRERVDVMLARLGQIAAKMDSVRRAFSGEQAPEASERGWAPHLADARRALKMALLRHRSADPAEQERIAAILRRAASDIDGTQGDA